MCIVLASAMVYVSFPERTHSSFCLTIYRDRQQLVQFCMPVVPLVPRVHLGSYPRKAKASHTQRILCSQLAAMKSYCADWASWTMPKRAQREPEGRMPGGGFRAKKL